MKRASKLSLFWILIAFFVVQIAAITAVLGYMSYRNGKSAVQDLAGQLMMEIGQRIEENLISYLQINEDLTRTNAGLLISGKLDLCNLDDLKQHFLYQMGKSSLASSVALATEQRDFVALERDDISLILREYDKRTRKFASYRLDKLGRRESLAGVVENYDPHNDPPDDAWYAKARKGAYWGVVVSLAKGDAEPELHLVRFQPIIDHEGVFKGVAASSMYLSQFGQFLGSLSIAKHGQAFVVDKQGFLVATSTGELPILRKSEQRYPQNLNIKNWRLAGVSSSNNITSATMRAVYREVKSLGSIDSPRYSSYILGDRRYLVQITPIKKGNLDLLALIVVPEADVMEQIRKNALNNIKIAIVALFVACIVGIALARWVTRPILQLNKAAMRIAEGEWEAAVPSGRQDEIGSLSEAFSSMAAQLKATFDELQNEIKERRHVEAELTSSNIILSAQQETTIDGILVVDENDRVILHNHRFLEMWGILAEVAENSYAQPVLQYVASQTINSEEFVNHAIEIYSNHDEIHREEIQLADGRAFDCYTAPMRHTDGKYFGRIWYFRDITEGKRIQEEKRNLEAQLLQSQKIEAIGQLAGGVAHDFNNLLTPILGYADLILNHLPEDDPIHSQLMQILQAARSASELTKQLLAFSRKQVLEMRPTDLNNIISDFQKMISRTLREDIELHVDTKAKDAWIKADAGQIRQVIMNLAINAQDAMPSGGTLTLATSNFLSNEAFHAAHPKASHLDYVLLEVSDTGIGMDNSIKEHIFEPFYSTKELGKGTGLGLSMVYGIVKQHGGIIEVVSELGHGSTFRVYLPRNSSEACHSLDTEAQRNRITRISTEETIMVVEDNRMVRELAGAILREHGYTVISAASGQECLDALRHVSKSIDLILTDVIMPDMNGKVLYEHITQTNPGVAVIYMSGYTENLIAHHGVLDDGVVLIQKPFTREVLLNTVRKVLG